MWTTKQQITSLIMMGRMPLDYFFNTKSQNVKNKCDTKSGT